MNGDRKNYLDESMEQFKLITEQSIIGIAILQDGVFKYVNDRFAEPSGYSVEEIKSWAPNKFIETIHPDYREFVEEQARKKQAGDPDVVSHYQYKALKKNGETLWIEIFSKTINYKGRPADLIMTFNNTDKVLAEQELKESEEKFRNIAEQSLFGIMIIQDGVIKYFNDIIVKVTKYSAEEIKSWAPYEFAKMIHPENREFVVEQARKKQADDPDVINQYKYRALKKNGEIYWVEVYAKSINYEGRPADFIMVHNITNKVLAEQKLKESEEKFRSIAEQSLIGIMILQDGVIKYLNDKATETIEYSAEEIKSLAPNEFIKVVHPEDREFVMEQARRKQRGDPDVINQYQYRIITKGGKIEWRKIFSKTINFEGHLADLIMTLDISDEIKAEQQLQESKEKYRTAYNQAEFYKDLFIHDINNILQSLFSSIQLIEMDIDELKKTNDSKELIEVMYGQIKRGIKLISNVRKLSQLENYEISFEEVDLCEMLNHSIEFIKNSFQNTEIQIEIDTFDKKISILGNDLLQDVFENILINSVKYNENDVVEILIKITQAEQDDIIYYKLEFIDNGIGIEDKRKEIVLSRINRDSKTTYGLGLGLSLVKKIIENYNGKIWVEDKVKGDYSKGTNIILLIPKGDLGD